MSDRVLLFGDFKGGENRGNPDALRPGEMQALEGFDYVDGDLRTSKGRVQQTSAVGTVAVGDEASLVEPVFISGTRYMLVWHNSKAHLSVELDSVGVGHELRRPIWHNTAYAYPTAGAAITQELSLVRFGDSVYLSTIWLPPMRWDGFIYYAGTVSDDGVASTIVGTGTSWLAANLRLGDSLFFRKTAIGAFPPNWQGPYYITAITDDTHLGLHADTNLVAGDGQVDYCIARTHYAGIAPINSWAGVPAAAAVGAGGSLSAGNYQVALTLYNSYTDTESAPYYISGAVACVASDSITVSTYNTGPNASGWQANYIRVYRTKVGGSVFYLDREVTRNQALYTFPATITLTQADSALGDELSSSARDMPPTGMMLARRGNRLVGYSPYEHCDGDGTYTAGNYRNEVWLSSLNRPEYWPQYNQADVSAFDFADAETTGCYFTIGRSSSEVMAVCPEMGAESSQSTQAGNLLILKQSGFAYRLFGDGLHDFTLDEAFPASCAAKGALVNANGVMIWVSPTEGLVGCVAGSSQPVCLSESEFPKATAKFADIVTAATATVDYMRLIRLVLWDDRVLMAYPETTSTVNNRLVVYHIPSQTFRREGYGGTLVKAAYLACTTEGDGTELNALYYADAVEEFIYRLFEKTGSNTYWSGTDGPEVRAKSPRVVLPSGKTSRAYNYAGAGNLFTLWKRPAAAQSLTLNVYVDGNSEVADTDTITIPAASGTVDGLVWVETDIDTAGRFLEFEITGEPTEELCLKRVEWECDDKGKTSGW